MNKRNAGFTIIEMLVVVAIFGLVLSGTSQMFIDILRTHRQQSRITETNIEGIIGLELLRQDLGKAGYGLPWNAGGGTFNYAEKDPNTYNLNDGPANSPGPANAPRGIVSANNVAAAGGILADTDYLAVKAVNVAVNAASAKWTFLSEAGAPASWTPASENLNPTDYVIVLSPGGTNVTSARILRTASTGALFSDVEDYASDVSSPETRLVYGIDTGAIRMPFNRADYFVMRPSSGMPRRCAVGTGILYKAVVNQSDGGVTHLPLLDCVADLQVVFRRDLNADDEGIPEDWAEDISASPVTDLRAQVKEVRVFILAHEGQQDTRFQYAQDSIRVGDGPPYNTGRLFDLTTISSWQNYRWKLYTLVVKLDNLN